MNNYLNKTRFTAGEIEQLSSLHFINRIDEYMKILSSIKFEAGISDSAHRVILLLDIFYHDKKVDTLTFDLHNYEFAEIVDIAQNIRGNEYILQEVDNFLGGDMAE